MIKLIIFIALGLFGHFAVNGEPHKIEIKQHFNGAIAKCMEEVENKGQQNDEENEDLFKSHFVECIKKLINDLLGHKNEENEKNVVKNWMNSFLNAKVKYGKNGKEFNVIFDSANNLTNLPGNFLLGNCPEEKVTNSKGKEVYASCRRHKMEIYTAPKPSRSIKRFGLQKTNCSEKFTQATYDGTEIEMQICHDKMEFKNFVAKNAYFIVMDGKKFEMFDLMLDSGAIGGPKIDGIFSLAFSSPKIGKKDDKNKLKSGIEFLLESSKNDKKATVFMQPFHQLDFLSGTTGAVTIGQRDSENCGNNWSELKIVDRDDFRWHVPMEASSKWPKEAEGNDGQWKGQKAMISTTDIFIFAPQSFTDPLFEKFKAIDDNAFFALGRYFGKFGLVPKDVLIKCPKEEEYAEMPTLKFKFGQTEFTLSPKEYIMPIVLPKLPIFGNLGVFNWCHSMIRPKPTSGMFAVHILPEGNKDTWILGQLLFNKVCVEFNYTNREIGVALVKKGALKN